MTSATLLCLALNLYHEARGEPLKGQAAVTEVVMKRVQRETWPDTPCEVVWQPKQFSWTIGYVHKPVPLDYEAVRLGLAGHNYSNGADHYHTIDIIPPDWTDDMEVVQVIGNHIFYRSNYE